MGGGAAEWETDGASAVDILLRGLVRQPSPVPAADRTDNLQMHPTATALQRNITATATCLALLLIQAVGAPQAEAIEMFTFFGDGSRIGLPSLEVPIEAYPGIPLRSDRLRARNRMGATRRGGPAGEPPTPGGITIRSMPTPQPVPRAANLPPAARSKQPPRPSTQALPAGQRGMRSGRTARPAPSRMPSSSQPDGSLQIPEPLAEQR